jgi:hypothetical protein
VIRAAALQLDASLREIRGAVDRLAYSLRAATAFLSLEVAAWLISLAA